MLFFTFFGHIFWAPIAVQRYQKTPGFGTVQEVYYHCNEPKAIEGYNVHPNTKMLL